MKQTYWEQNRLLTKQGVLEGIEKDGVKAFLGVPYAAPPVGERRWRIPDPPGSWFGIRQAKSYSASSFQPSPLNTDPSADNLFTGPMSSEDCLYLNIFSPAKRVDEKLPIFVWLHGGGMWSGTAMANAYDGYSLARKGMIVIPVNYRLGFFGFFCHPELREESEYGTCGNYALWDMRQAVLWIRENAAAFGGDPENITVGGQSGGAVGSNTLINSPMMEGLIRRVIIESGTCIHGNMPAMKREDLEQIGLAFGNAIGCPSLSELRAMDACTLYSKALEHWVNVNYCVDGCFLLDTPQNIAANHKLNHMEMIVGAAAQEFASELKEDTISPERFEAHVLERFGDKAEEILAMYPHGTSAEAGHSYHTLISDLHFIGVIRTAELMKENGLDCYAYYCNKNALGENGELVGALHSGELPYLFGWVNTGRSNLAISCEWTEAEYKLHESMTDFWANFIRTGDPGGIWKKADGRYDVLELGDHLKMMGEENSRRLELAYEIMSDPYSLILPYLMQ